MTRQQVRELALYEYTPWMVRAGVAALFGAPAEGRLPVDIPGVADGRFAG
ncbi:hypothetical protein [Alicyclobacillus shizuokensis]|nr:hypothetical protein [Alicyclobacillus shizuokensis]MCL6625899.1 hypothetical protein [Alicyclobacillus shizuokensis]